MKPLWKAKLSSRETENTTPRFRRHTIPLPDFGKVSRRYLSNESLGCSCWAQNKGIKFHMVGQEAQLPGEAIGYP